MRILEEVVALYETGAVGPGLRPAADHLSAEQLEMASADVLYLLDFRPVIRSMRSEGLRSSPKRLAGLQTFVAVTEELSALFSVSDQAELQLRDRDQERVLIDFVRSKKPPKVERTLF